MKATHETTKVANEFADIWSQIQALRPTKQNALLRQFLFDAALSTYSDLTYATSCSTRLLPPTPYPVVRCSTSISNTQGTCAALFQA